MAIVDVVIGALAALIGLTGVLSPDTTKKLAGGFRGPAGMYTAVIVRFVTGALLIWTAPACRPEMPWVGWTIRAVGALAIALAIGLLLLGHARYQALIDWSLRQPTVILRGTSFLVLLVGVFLIYAGT